jgi:hypothetical protein
MVASGPKAQVTHEGVDNRRVSPASDAVSKSSILA